MSTNRRRRNSKDSQVDVLRDVTCAKNNETLPQVQEYQSARNEVVQLCTKLGLPAIHKDCSAYLHADEKLDLSNVRQFYKGAFSAQPATARYGTFFPEVTSHVGEQALLDDWCTTLASPKPGCLGAGKSNATLLEMELSYKKLYGPQGGSLSLIDQLPGIAQYFNKTCKIPSDSPTLLVANQMDYISYLSKGLRRLPDGKREKLEALSYDDALNRWLQSPKRAGSGFPLKVDKRSPLNLSHVKATSKSYAVSLTGQRIQRNVVKRKGVARCIFQTPHVDLINDMRVLYPFKDFMQSAARDVLPEFSMLNGVDEVGKHLHEWDSSRPSLLKMFAEGDADGCDICMSEEHGSVVGQILKGLFNKADAIIDDMIHRSFTMDLLILDDLALSGSHSLFSGVGPTQDLETIYLGFSWWLFPKYHYLYTLSSVSELTISSYKNGGYKLDQYLMNKWGPTACFVIGDDVTLGIMVPSRLVILARKDDSRPITITGISNLNGINQEAVACWMNQCGFRANLEKQAIRFGVTSFCKRVFTLSETVVVPHVDGALVTIVAPVYPTVLALNSIVFPEKLGEDGVWGYSKDIQRTAQILDECKYHPSISLFTKLVKTSMRDLEVMGDLLVDSSVENLLPVSEFVGDAGWSPLSSLSLPILVSRPIPVAGKSVTDPLVLRAWQALRSLQYAMWFFNPRRISDLMSLCDIPLTHKSIAMEAVTAWVTKLIKGTGNELRYSKWSKFPDDASFAHLPCSPLHAMLFQDVYTAEAMFSTPVDDVNSFVQTVCKEKENFVSLDFFSAPPLPGFIRIAQDDMTDGSGHSFNQVVCANLPFDNCQEDEMLRYSKVKTSNLTPGSIKSLLAHVATLPKGDCFRVDVETQYGIAQLGSETTQG